uniref:Uncharacterized protein n=1 Tax=Anopheles dirus TaxID=7168 RepID=A0A182N1C9_9DIPT
MLRKIIIRMLTSTSKNLEHRESTVARGTPTTTVLESERNPLVLSASNSRRGSSALGAQFESDRERYARERELSPRLRTMGGLSLV